MSRTSRSRHKHSAWSVLLAFLLLGCTSFGGPTAHLSYFRTEFVERRKWLSDSEYLEIVTLSQFLPGPSSSQVGFGIGLRQAGLLGAVAAFVGFTLPSALLLIGFAFGATALTGTIADGAISGLLIAAVAIVAHAVLGMTKAFTPDAARATIAVVAAGSALLIPGIAGQLIALGCGALAGVLWCRQRAPIPEPKRTPVVGIRSGVAVACAVIFAALLVGVPLIARLTGSEIVAQFDAFYRAGALVFGGGHVVLPLLEAGVVNTGAVSAEAFLTGYGAAQAVPGPLFTVAAYLGAVSEVGLTALPGALIALIAIFLPGFLLYLAVLPFWSSIHKYSWATGAITGMSAAVVGILGAAFYTPVFTTAIHTPQALVLALACFVLLAKWRMAPWAVVLGAAVGGILLDFSFS